MIEIKTSPLTQIGSFVEIGALTSLRTQRMLTTALITVQVDGVETRQPTVLGKNQVGTFNHAT